jgi:3D-(3,5/4)-trihydroxycyclohexane-1,2-dione acylhydrolase (decyclizing)
MLILQPKRRSAEAGFAEMASRTSSRVHPSAATIRLTTGEALVRFLVAQFSERDGHRRRLINGMFGIFGHGNTTGVGAALERHAGDLPYIQVRNEQGMVHMAVGYARRARRLSTYGCTASIGPGATNLVTGAATATVNRLPVLLIPGDVYAGRQQGTVLQQLEHPTEFDASVNDTLRPVSRFFDRISRPEQLVASLPEAMRVLSDPAETGAVTIAIPQDVGPEEGRFPVRLFEPRVWAVERRPPTAASIADAVRLLRTSRRPLLIAGGGVHYSDAGAELAQVAQAFGIPVAETFAGKGAMQVGTELLLGGLGVEGTGAANEVAARADVVIAVGTRLGDFVTASRSLFQDPDVRIIAINVSGHDAIKLGAVPVLADAREALRALLDAGLDAGIGPDAAYQKAVEKARDRWRQTIDVHFATIDTDRPTQGQVIRVLNETMRDGDVVVAASGAPPGDLLKLWDATEGRACQIEFGFSCMGHEVPGGIGARLAATEGEVVVYVGDGAYLMNPGELLTAIQEGLKMTVLIVDNHGFQIIRRLQLSKTGRPFGNELRYRDRATGALTGAYVPVDLAMNAASLGARTWRVDDLRALRTALAEARAATTASVIVVEVAQDCYLPPSGAWWDVAPPAVSDEPETNDRRAEYERGRRLQRFYG